MTIDYYMQPQMIESPFRTRVKICCISSVDEARMAVQAGADALGLVGRMPSGPGVVADQLAAQIVRATPPPVATFMLTSETEIKNIVAHQQRVGANTIQLVDAVSASMYAQLRAALPMVKLVQVLHVIDERSMNEAHQAIENGVDALLLDSGNPYLTIKELGGTGRVHNWQISRQIVDQSRVPVFLAGGLNSDNVRQAIEMVRPYGLDICSGVRSNGQLDERKLTAFMSAIRL